MRLQRKLTNKEWKEIGEKYKDGGVHMYRGKKTFFYTGEELWEENENEDEEEEEEGWPLIYDWDERCSWEVIIILPGVEIIPTSTFECTNVKVVIMADTVQRIEKCAFDTCDGLEFVKLSRNLEYIGDDAFYGCLSLTSIFVPPSCTEIEDRAFNGCTKLIILGLPLHTQLGEGVFESTALIKRSPIETDEDGEYDHGNEEEAVQWVKSINNEEIYSLHRACSSFNPLPEVVHELIMRQGIKAMGIPNEIGISPSQYLEANTFADISEKEIVNRYILDSMGEVI